jgi:hypothetical protein
MEFHVGKVLNSRIIESAHLFLDHMKREESRKVEVQDIEKFGLNVDRDWEFGVLNDVRVVGVDGSQINHLREFGIPFGAVQVAKVAVLHGKARFNVDYRCKWIGLNEDASFERFKLEIQSLIEEIEMAGESYLFMDGSFVLSFTSQFRKELRDAYIESVNELLQSSEMNQTPVFGFIERSYARDLTSDPFIHDALFLSTHLRRFEYTEPLKCERDISGYRSDVYFSYLKLNAFPVRIEFPGWMADDHSKFMEIAAAECLIGSTRNYPYILERAHRYAVISEKEREAIGLFLAAKTGKQISMKYLSKR